MNIGKYNNINITKCNALVGDADIKLTVHDKAKYDNCLLITINESYVGYLAEVVLTLS